MRILYKKDSDLFFIGTPDEKVLVGDSIDSNGLISQVLDIAYADLPGILEHILRQSMIPKEQVTREILPDVQRTLETLTDQKLIITKIRGHREDNAIQRGIGHFDVSREKTSPGIVDQHELFATLGVNSNEATRIATSISSSDPQNFSIDPNSLGITLVTGQKGFGKSYFTKKLLLRLINSDIGTIVFDPNNEYSGLKFDTDGNQNDYFPRMLTLDPDITEVDEEQGIAPFRINLSDISAEEFCNLYNIATDSPTAGVVQRFWNQNRDRTTRRTTPFSVEDFQQWIEGQNGMNEMVQQALISRCNQASDSSMFGQSNLRGAIQNISQHGGALVINMRTVSPYFKPHLVNTVLSNAQAVTQDGNPLALFLEEAQLYVEGEKKYQDLLTRMRHIGLKPIFITNAPRTLPDQVLSLSDNIFAFGFESEYVIKHLSSSGKTDLDTINTIKNLKKRQCLAIGDLTNGYPLFLETLEEPNVDMRGETQEFNVNAQQPAG